MKKGKKYYLKQKARKNAELEFKLSLKLAGLILSVFIIDDILTYANEKKKQKHEKSS